MSMSELNRRPPEEFVGDFVYWRPEPRLVFLPELVSEKHDQLRDEMDEQLRRGAYSRVEPVEGYWSRDSVLAAIETGAADSFTVNWQYRDGQTPIISEVFSFDDREFAGRVAERVLNLKKPGSSAA